MVRPLPVAYAIILLSPSVITETFHPGPKTAEAFGRLPLHFEANLGQTDPQVRFLARAPGYTMFFTPQEAVLSRPSGDVRLRLNGAHPHTPEGVNPLSGRTNYFLGNNPAMWQTDVPQFSKVRYRQAYPGIDIVYYGNQRQLEYDFVIAPGADPAAIQLHFEGANALRIADSGDLLIDTPGGEIRQHKPIVYQQSAEGRRNIDGRYIETGDNSVGFTLGSYDPSRELVIDPVLTYATYLGGSGDETARGIAVDSAGNMYVAGRTTSTRFSTAAPLPNSYQGGIDAFVAKLNPAGNALLYLTFFGGAGVDSARAIAIDSAGNAYVTGETTSTDFPSIHALQSVVKSRDAFVTKLNSAGNALIYSTYLGGDGLEIGYAIAVDSTGSAYVAGITESANFPTKGAISNALGGTSDAFVSKLSSDGTSLLYSTYLGGLGGESAFGIAVDSSGSAYVTGYTGSNGFQLVNPLQRIRGAGIDAFVSKFNPAGSALIYSTFIGGASDDEGDAIAIDAAGNVYVAGSTSSADFPLVNAAQRAKGGASTDKDAFVLKVNAGGTALVYSTLLGGNDIEQAAGIAVDSAGNAYVAGTTQSSNFPAVGALQPSRGQDAFIAQYSPAGALLFSSPFGGNGSDSAVAVAADAQANLYLCGSTDSADFPLSGAIQNMYAGGSPGFGDAFIVRLKFTGTTVAPLSMVSAASFTGDTVAPDSIVAAFGQGLAADILVPAAGDFPTSLGGVSLRITDSASVDRQAQLYFVSPGEINFVMPAGMASGPAQVTVLRNGQALASGSVKIAPVAPGIFTANSSGQGPAAALFLRVAADGTQTSGLTFQCPSAGNCVNTPIDLGSSTDQVFLSLFGTGLRGRSSPAGVTATIGGQSSEVLGAVAQGQYPGFDQANLRIPRQLIGRGEVNVALTLDGKAANTITINIGGPPPPVPPTIAALNPSSGTQGQTIATFTITGQNLAGITSIDFSPAADITVSNISASATSVTAQLALGVSAATGARSVTVSSPGGRSNALNFSIQAAPPPPGGEYLPVKTGLAWDYQVTFPDTVQLPYNPIVEAPQGLLCASIFCGTKQFTAGQINFRVTVNESLGVINGGESFRVTVADPGGDFYFARKDPVEMRVRPVGGNLQLELIDTPSGFRLVRPLAQPSAAELAQKSTLTVAAGSYTDVVKTTLTLVGDGIYVQGIYTTDVYLAPAVGMIKAVMHDPSGKTLFTQELTAFTQPITGFTISNLRAGPSVNQSDGVTLPIVVDFQDSSGSAVAADGTVVVNFSILNGNLKGFTTVKAGGATAGQTSGTMNLNLFFTRLSFSGSLSIDMSLKNSKGTTSNTLSGFFQAQ